MVHSVKLVTQTAQFLPAQAQMNAPNVTTHIIDSMASVIPHVQKDMKTRPHLQTFSVQDDTWDVKPAIAMLIMIVLRAQLGTLCSQNLLRVIIHVQLDI